MAKNKMLRDVSQPHLGELKRKQIKTGKMKGNKETKEAEEKPALKKWKKRIKNDKRKKKRRRRGASPTKGTVPSMAAQDLHVPNKVLSYSTGASVSAKAGPDVMMVQKSAEFPSNVLEMGDDSGFSVGFVSVRNSAITHLLEIIGLFVRFLFRFGLLLGSVVLLEMRIRGGSWNHLRC